MLQWLSVAALTSGIVLGLTGLSWTLRLALSVPEDTIITDYQLYAGATEAILEGRNPYDVHVPSDDGTVQHGYVYPPIVAWAMTPFVVVPPFRVGYLAWIAVCGTSLIASLVLLMRGYRQKVAVPVVVLVLGGCTLAFYVRTNLYHGQIDMILLLAATGGLWFMMRGQPVLTGILVGVAASVKPFLGVLLLLLAWRGQWRAAASMIATGVVLLVVGFGPTLLHGSAALEGWIAVSRYKSSPEYAAMPFNNALSALFLRLFTETPFAQPWLISQTMLVLANGLLLAIVVAAWVWAVPRGAAVLKDLAIDLQAQAGLLLWTDASLLIGLVYAYGPLAEANHYFMLIPGMVATIRLATLSPNRAVRLRWRPAAIAWGLLILVLASPIRTLSWAQFPEGYPTGLNVLWTGRLGLLLLGVVLVTAWCRWREARATARLTVS
jgi:hypothetical protein